MRDAAPQIQAHRAGPVVAGEARFAEQTLPAFAHAWGVERVIAELDVRLTADGVPVVFHDVTLRRLTGRRDRVDEIDLATYRSLRADLAGTGQRLARAREPVPLATLEDVLALARATAAPLNVELKRLPGEPGFDASPDFAARVAEALEASGIPPARLAVQSFWDGHLAVLGARLPRVRRTLLVRGGATTGACERAVAHGCDAVGFKWATDPGLVERAHAAGLRAMAYTVNAPDDVRDAARAGVDVLITDDASTARRALATLPAAAGAVA